MIGRNSDGLPGLLFFEPFFDPVGSYSVLADNTYKFGLHGITIGSWLAEKLTAEYGMHCDWFEFGFSKDEYRVVNTGTRKKVLFYARPVTPRRGFELGILSLELFHKKHPEYEINLLGWDLSDYDIPFPYVNSGILSAKELNVLYNECVAGLVLSFTNMSLLPLEMLAAGCVPVVNEAEHTHKVGYADALEYAEPLPSSIASKLEEVIDQYSGRSGKQVAAAIADFEWQHSYQSLEKILKSQLS